MFFNIKILFKIIKKMKYDNNNFNKLNLRNYILSFLFFQFAWETIIKEKTFKIPFPFCILFTININK